MSMYDQNTPQNGSSFGLGGPNGPSLDKDVPPPVSTSQAAEPPVMAQAEAIAQTEAILEAAQVPPLKPMPWRIGDRNRVRSLLVKLTQFVDDDGNLSFSGLGEGVTRFDSQSIETLAKVDAVMEEADDTFQRLAIDPEGYARWSASLKSPETVLAALIGKYGRLVGEQMLSPAE